MVEQWHGMEVRPAALADRFCRLGRRFGRQSMTRGLTVEACIARCGCLGVVPWGFAPPDLRNMSSNMTGQAMAS